MAEMSGGVSAGEVSALIASMMPQPASSVPPGVTDSGAIGAGATYARGDHTHASKARKQRVTGINTATYTWVYPTPFGAGVVPIVPSPCIEDPANSVSDVYNAQIVGAPTATQCVVRITRQSNGLFGLLTGALGINPNPATVNLHLLALEP